jgi:hypothetical protein
MNRPSGILGLLLLAAWLGPAVPTRAQDSSTEAPPSQDALRDSPVQDSPARMAAVAMVETILAGDDGEPAWDALASALGGRAAGVSPVGVSPAGGNPAGGNPVGGNPVGIRPVSVGSATSVRARAATRAGEFVSSVRTLPLTAETIAIAGVLALLSFAALAVLVGSMRKGRPLMVNGGGGARPGRVRRFRRAGGRSRSGPVCRDAARLEARLRSRRSA